MKLYPLIARRSRDLTVQRRVRRLRSNRRYYFRFIQGRRRSKRGTFRTAPSRNSNATIDFAWTGDTDALPLKGTTGAPYWNNFDVFRRMRAERNDFNIHLGDTIYSDSEVPNRQQPVALTRQAEVGQVQGQPPPAQAAGPSRARRASTRTGTTTSS